MWILESNGDFLQGKRMWLKPGQKYLFGRVKREGVHFAIDHKTVSRKHFIIEVEPVKEGDVSRIHSRTKIRIEDQNSKSGTSVNGELIKNSSKELKSEENSVRPGTLPHEITISWQPCVLTFNLLKKEVKSGVLKTKQLRVQAFDIKATSDFISEHTTHLVANKRNTAKGLQALITGKYLVSESYLDAIEYAATPTNLSQEENLSPLELDFDNAWPNPNDHLPPAGKEPTARPVESYQPDLSRVNVFEGYTFVFGDQTQYDNLLPVVTNGHGKAILYKVVNGESSTDDLLQFLRNASDHKMSGNIENRGWGGPILVRWTGKEDVQEWTNSLINEVALKMDQRAIEQSEFLDAILANDASLLKQTIPFESTNEGRVAPPPSAAASLTTRQPTEIHSNSIIRSRRAINGHDEQTAPVSSLRDNPPAEVVSSQEPSQYISQDSVNEEPAARPYKRPRFTQLSKLKSFDDDFDPDAVVEYNDDNDVADESYISDPDTQQKTRGQLPTIKEEPPSTSKKRPRTSSQDLENDFAGEMDDLLPAATAFKKRKLAEARSNAGVGVIEEPEPIPPPKKKKKERELDVRKVLGLQREEEEEAARRAEEYHNRLGDINDKEPANLVEIVTMQLPVRDRNGKQQAVNGEHGESWDPKWNGRKNFKGFRRKGEAPQRRGHAMKVIVPLVEIKRQTHGIGERYWDKSEQEKDLAREKKRREKAKTQRTQSQTQRASGSSANGTRSRTNVISDDEDLDEDDEENMVEPTSPAIQRLQREAAKILHHDIDPDTPRRTRAAEAAEGDATQQLSQTQRLTQTESQSSKAAASSAKAKGKRPATSATSSAPKRQKTLPVTVMRDSNSEEDDSDDMKFRFGSRARRGRGRGRGRGLG